jgi:hypothetical protein
VALGYVRGATETAGTPGTEAVTSTTSTKKVFFPLTSFKHSANITHLERDDELRNQDEPLSVLAEKYDPSWELTSRLYPDLAGLLHKGALGAPTSTAGNGVITDPDATVIPTGATRHVWTAPFGPTGVSPQTMAFDPSYKDQGVYFALRGAATSSISVTAPEDGGAMITAGGPAAYHGRVSDPGLSPTYEALTTRPWTRGNLTLSWMSGSATTEDFSLDMSAPVDMVRSLGVASKYPDVVEKGEGLITWTGKIKKRQLDQDDWDALLNATGFAATAKFVSDTVIASGYPHKLYYTFSNCQYVGGDPDDLSNRRRHGAEFDFKATYASSASVTVTLVNATTSYA